MEKIVYDENRKLRKNTNYQRTLFFLIRIPVIRGWAYRLLKRSYHLPDSTGIGSEFRCNAPLLCIGSRVWLNDTFIVAYAPITIGDGTSFSYRNSIITSTHDFSCFGTVIGLPVVIGKNCWITTNVTILGGVKIGDNTVIAAGSVVTHDIPSNVLAGGVPCEVIKKISFRR